MKQVLIGKMPFNLLRFSNIQKTWTKNVFCTLALGCSTHKLYTSKLKISFVYTFYWYHNWHYSDLTFCLTIGVCVLKMH